MMRRWLMGGVWAGAVVGLLAAAALGQADAGGLRFRGVGAARQALDAMQLKPFDRSLWATVTEWSGEPVKPETTEGKVVMIITWASWHKVSHPAMRAAAALHERYKGQGLVVVGVHNPRGFEGAAANAKELGVTFPYAWDKDGKFRQGLRGDLDPNVYLIDRAGNLRYAQVETASAEAGVTQLIGETVEQAKGVPAGLEARRASTEKERWKTADVGSGFKMGEAADVAFTKPEDEEYKKVKWPFMVGKVEKDDLLEKISNDPPRLKMPGDDEWAPAKPKYEGRIVVLYFVDPRVDDMLRVIPVMNAVQDEYRRDAVVVCALARIGKALTDSGQDDPKTVQRNRGLIEEMLRSRRINHALTPKTMRVDRLEFSEESLRQRPIFQREELGFAALLSTDDKIRWLGSPYSEDMRRSLDRLIAVDPGVQARRRAEEAKPKGGK